MEIAVGILAFSNLILAIVSVLTLFKVAEVEKATNGMVEQLQDESRRIGYEAGHDAAEQEAEDEAAQRDKL